MTEYKVMERITDFKQLKNEDHVVRLFASGMLSVGKKMKKIYSLNVKSNLYIKMILYALIDFYNEGKTQTSKTNIIEKMKENKLKYLEIIEYRTEHDPYIMDMMGDLCKEKIREYKEAEDFIVYNSVSSSFRVLESIFITFSVRPCNGKGKYFHMVKLTSVGLEVKDLVDQGYVF